MSYVQFCDEIAEFESKVKALDVASEICNNIQFSEYEKKLEKIIRGI